MSMQYSSKVCVAVCVQDHVACRVNSICKSKAGGGLGGRSASPEGEHSVCSGMGVMLSEWIMFLVSRNAQGNR